MWTILTSVKCQFSRHYKLSEEEHPQRNFIIWDVGVARAFSQFTRQFISSVCTTTTTSDCPTSPVYVVIYTTVLCQLKEHYIVVVSITLQLLLVLSLLAMAYKQELNH